MRILHYIHGLPPVKVGGLIRYAVDLAIGQAENGQETILLFPGPIALKKASVSIKRWKRWRDIPCYRIYNPQYISNGYGIKEPELFMHTADINIFIKWLERIKPDVIHVHSFMGLYLEFLQAAKCLGIKIFYTTHDFFGLCPKIDLLRNGNYCKEPNWDSCANCCCMAYNEKRLWLEQTDLYRLCRKSDALVKVLHSSLLRSLKAALTHENVNGMMLGQENLESEVDITKREQYRSLQKYYLSFFELIDHYHFNSKQTRSVYEERLGRKEGITLPVQHKDIIDRRKIRKYGNILRLGYLGTEMALKGYDFLIDELIKLYDKGKQEFVLNTYVVDGRNENFIKNHGPYKPERLEEVFSSMDLLIVPSLGLETFGMVVLEAFSFGVPVLMSEHVGAKMLVEEMDNVGMVFSFEKGDFLNDLERIYDHREILLEMNKSIMRAPFSFDHEKHVQKVLAFYGSK